MPPAGNAAAPSSGILVKPDPAQGRIPLSVTVNMCKSALPPDPSSRFTVDWGDGARTRGSCRQDHVYERPGRFEAEACASERVPDGPRSCRAFTVDARGPDAGDDDPGPGPELPFAVRTRGAGAIRIAVPNVTQLSVGEFLEGTPLTLAELRSARRIVVTVQLTAAECPTHAIGLYNEDGGLNVFFDGAPNLSGRTGTISYQLNPDQFTGDVIGFAHRDGSGDSVPCDHDFSSRVVRLYR